MSTSQHNEGLAPNQARIAHDEEIADDVRENLIRDERVDAREVHVSVDAGVATLIGEVSTLAAKRAAGSDAWDAVGVVDVLNLLVVREWDELEGPR